MPDSEEIRNFQLHKLGREFIKGEPNDHAILELMPLPNPGISQWIYGDLGIGSLYTRKMYLEIYKPARIKRLISLIKEHKPQLVVFYSTSYLEDWKKIASCDLTEVQKDQYMGFNDKTLFCVLRHPVAHGISNYDWERWGQEIYNRMNLSRDNKEHNFQKVEPVSTEKVTQRRQIYSSEKSNKIIPKTRINTSSIAKFSVSDELQKKGFTVHYYGKDFLVNGKVVNVKGCNYNNDWVRKINSLGGWDRIDPNRFDYFIGVSFDESGNNVRYFIFSKEETQEFDNAAWKDSQGLKNLTLYKNNDDSERIIKSSEDQWDKITKMS